MTRVRSRNGKRKKSVISVTLGVTPNDDSTIRGLDVQLKALVSEIELLQIEQDTIKKQLSTKTHVANQLKQKLDALRRKPTAPKVTDHAIIRYFERVLGFDIKEIEDKILSNKVLNMIDVLGSTGRYPNDGFMVVMKQNQAVTILTNDDEA